MTIDRPTKTLLWSLAFLLMVVSHACVNLPTEGQPAPDYRSVVRYLHAGRGVDTVSFLVSTFKDTVVTTTRTSLGGSDTAREVKTTLRSYSTYRRIRVDFSSNFDVLVDNSSIGTLKVGDVTPYFDTPSGSRKIYIRASGKLIDSVAIKDTAINIVRDTIRAGGSRVTELQISKPGLFVLPGTGDVTQIVDTAASPISIDAQAKMTVFLMGDTIAANISSRSALVRFGRIMYTRSIERRVFDPTGLPDTALIRFVNVSKNVAGAIGFKRAEQASADASVGFSKVTGYLKFPARVDTTYSFKIMRGSTTIDSARVSVSKLVRYTTVVLDSANSWSIKTYRDE